MINAPTIWPKVHRPMLKRCLCFAPSAVTSVTLPLGLVLQNTRDQSVSLHWGEEC